MIRAGSVMTREVLLSTYAYTYDVLSWGGSDPKPEPADPYGEEVTACGPEAATLGPVEAAPDREG
jgi:hypothetical protein